MRIEHLNKDEKLNLILKQIEKEIIEPTEKRHGIKVIGFKDYVCEKIGKTLSSIINLDKATDVYVEAGGVEYVDKFKFIQNLHISLTPVNDVTTVIFEPHICYEIDKSYIKNLSRRDL